MPARLRRSLPSPRPKRIRGAKEAFGFLAVLTAVATTCFGPAAWAVDGGYGPGGSPEIAGAGAFGDVLVAKTLGPSGGTIIGRIGSAVLTVVVPGGAVGANNVVEVVSWTPNCAGLKNAKVIVAFAVFATDGTSRSGFVRAPAEFVSSPSLASNSSTVYNSNVGCAGSKLPVNHGTLWLPPETSPMFAVVSADPVLNRFGGWFPHDILHALLSLLQET